MKENHHYILTRTADNDLIEIWDYVAARSFSVATRLTDDQLDLCDLLGKNVLLGEAFDSKRQFLRRFSRGNYVIYYQTSTEPITIVRVLHGARDASELV